MGHLLEPIARQMLAKRLRLEIRPNTASLCHNLFAFCAATPDGVVIDRGEIVALAECKAPSKHMWHHWGEDGDPDGIPDYVVYQANAQCAIWHQPICHVSALLGNEVRTYAHHYDVELAVETFGLCSDWWMYHVEQRVAPPVDGSSGASRMLKAMLLSQEPPLRSSPRLVRSKSMCV